MPTSFSDIRAEFPALDNWTFLNTATFGQLPRRATDAVAAHFAHRDREACANFLDWFADADRIRSAVAQLVHCRPDDIGFIPNASSGVAAIVNGLDWNRGDRIVTLTDEFPNNSYNPAVLASCGVEPIETPWESFYDSITPRTRLVLLSMVNYVTGFRPPLAEIAAFLRERDVIFCVDGTQTLGALQLDLSVDRPDVLVVDAYKWMLGPTGSGFLYVAPELRPKLRPSVIGWRSHKTWREVDNLHHGTPEFKDATEKFEGGMLSFGPLYGMEASINLMLELGVERIEQRVMELANQVRDVLRRHGATLLSDEAPHHDSPVVAARFSGRDASALAKALYQDRVIVSARHGYLRVSTHFYNNEADIEQFEKSLSTLG